jgi:hypothetical protein
MISKKKNIPEIVLLPMNNIQVNLLFQVVLCSPGKLGKLSYLRSVGVIGRGRIYILYIYI